MIGNSRLPKTLLFFVGLASFGLALWAWQPYVSLFNSAFLALIIVITVSPLLNWLKRKGVPNWAAFVITLLALIVVGVALMLFLAYSLGQFSSALPAYLEQLEVGRDGVESWAESIGLESSGIRAVWKVLDPQRLIALVVDLLAGVVGAVYDLVIVLITAAFLLIEAFGFPRKLQRLVRYGEERWVRASRYARDIQRYVIITTYVGAGVGLCNTVLLWALGVDFALLWGVVAFLFNYIPIIGYWVALIPPVLLALLEFGPGRALLVFLGYWLINGTAENVLKPKLMGEGLNLAPVVVFLSVFFWGAVLGPLGALLSIPMTMAIKELLLAGDENLVWLAELLSARGVDEPEAGLPSPPGLVPGPGEGSGPGYAID
jgi:predicted PurR-regulated permease PerM